MRWAGYVAFMGERRGAYRVLVGKPEGKRPLGRTGRRWVGYNKWISKKLDGEAWNRSIWLRIGTGGGHL
jgi:hypothetical protein